MGVRIEKGDSVITAYLVGDIDHHSARPIREEIDSVVQKTSPDILFMDFGSVSFMDSSGIGLVMGRYKLLKQLDGEVRLINVKGYIKRVMKLAGLDSLVSIEEV